MEKIKIVAEIGCNHNGDKELARKLVDAAKDCGVDAVKFQTFIASDLISEVAPKAEYQKATTGEDESQLEMTRKLELSQNDFIELKSYAKGLGLEVFSTPFDLTSVSFLEEQGQSIWKIPSGEITNLPYLKKIGNIQVENKKIILSTGMATLDEIRTCVDVLVKNGSKKEDIIILHCNTEYPTPDVDVNLFAIRALQNAFPEHKIGFSDHSVGSVAAIGASMFGIVMIEKHFTLDKNLPGPDHKASASPEELKDLVEGVRRIEVMSGICEKLVTDSERKNMVIARKSIIASRDITEGEVFTIDNLACKRPGNGISPMRWYDMLGRRAERDYKKDELIRVRDIEWQEA